MESNQKARYFVAGLAGLILLQFGVLAVLRWVEIPYYEQALIHEEVTLKDLELEKSKQYDKAGVTQALADYKEQSAKIKLFDTARKNVFVFTKNETGEKFDFFPPVVSILLPTIKNHLHNGVTLEGVAINEKAEVVMAVHAANYETLAIQYAALKSVFAKEPTQFFKDIKLNTFTSADTDITERDAKGALVKRKSELVKATIAMMINPEFFPDLTVGATTPAAVTPNQKQGVLSWFGRLSQAFAVISHNVVSDFHDLVGAASVQPVPVKQVVAPVVTVPLTAISGAPPTMVAKPVVPLPAASQTPPTAVAKQIVTSVMPTFTWKGGAWVSVAKALSTYLAAGKTIKAGDTMIDPHEAYTADELKKRAGAMMETILTESSFKTIRFHQIKFDPVAVSGDTIDLITLNSDGVGPK